MSFKIFQFPVDLGIGRHGFGLIDPPSKHDAYHGQDEENPGIGAISCHFMVALHAGIPIMEHLTCDF